MWPLLALIALAQEPSLPEGIKRVYGPRDAAQAAMVHCLTLPPHKRQYAFYVFQDGTEKGAAAVAFTMNAVVSQSASILSPVKADGWHLSCWFLDELWPDRKSFDRGWKVLQELAEDEPYFTQRAAVPQVKTIYKTVPWYRASDGKWYDWISETVVENRRFEPALGSGGAGPLLLLRDLAGGNLLPIVRADWFIATAWSSVDLDGIRGRYYELAGIERNPRGKTAFDAFLEQFGGDAKAVEKLRSDQRTVMISGVTKRPRRIDMFPSLAVRPEFGPAYITVTHDLNNKSVLAERDPLLNLLEFEDQAREIIAPGRNGLHRFLLTNGKGEIQDLAPDNVAVWRESPHPQSTQLINGISCLGCHGGNRGYNPTENYVRELKKDGFVPIGDLKPGLSYQAVYDRLVGLYDGEFNLPLRQAANGYALAMDKATWGVFGVKSVEGASAEVVRIWGSYFQHLTPEMVLRELGYEYKGPLPLAKVYALVVPKSADEHAWIASPRANLPLVRQQMHAVYYEMSLRDVLRPKAEWTPPARPPELKKGERNNMVGILALASGGVAAAAVGRMADSTAGKGAPSSRDSDTGKGEQQIAPIPSARPAGEQAPTGRNTTRKPISVEWGEGTPGLEIVAPPGSKLWFHERDWGGIVGPSGRRFYGLRTMRGEREVWLGCKLTLQRPDGVVLRGVVDLVYDKRVVVTWLAA